MNGLTAAAPYVLSLGGAAFVTALIIQCVVKPIIKWKITSANPNQNVVVRAAVYIVALLVVLASEFLHYQLGTRSDVSAALGIAFPVAGLAISGYHVLTSADTPTEPIAVPTTEPTPLVVPPIEGTVTIP